MFGQGKELGAVERALVFEHAVESVKEFAHDGDEGLHFSFAALDEVEVESAQVGLMADGDQGGHVEGATQVAVTGFADAGFLVHGAAGGVLAGVEAGLGDPLADVQVGREQGELRQDLQGAGGAAAGGAEQQLVTEVQIGVLGDHLDRAAGETVQGSLQGAQAAFQIAPDVPGAKPGRVGRHADGSSPPRASR